MKCDSCGKREATIHFKQIINGRESELHLCEECAESRGVTGFGPMGHFESCHFELADLLAGLAGLAAPSAKARQKPPVCPNCGLSYEDFRKSGRFGCSECYTAFREVLEVLLKRIHGADRHPGRRPSRISGETKEEAGIARLRRLLEEAVRREEYEKAAELRDRIREAEKRPGK